MIVTDTDCSGRRRRDCDARAGCRRIRSIITGGIRVMIMIITTVVQQLLLSGVLAGAAGLLAPGLGSVAGKPGVSHVVRPGWPRLRPLTTCRQLERSTGDSEDTSESEHGPWQAVGSGGLSRAAATVRPRPLPASGRAGGCGGPGPQYPPGGRSAQAAGSEAKCQWEPLSATPDPGHFNL